MRSLDDLYAEALTLWSDVQGHLETFVRLVQELEARTVVELGTRGGVSTIAWLYALQHGGHLWSVDIEPGPDFGDYPHWTFIQGDDTSGDVLFQLPDQADITFIDTSHAYQHTLRELELYVPRTRPGGRVLLHDTELEYPDFIGPSIAFPVKRAIEVFTAAHGLKWTNLEHDYGLGIVEV